MNTTQDLRIIESTPDAKPQRKADDGCRSDQCSKYTHREIIRLATFEHDGGNVQTCVSLSERTKPDGKTSQCVLVQSWVLKDGQGVPCCTRCFGLPSNARPTAPNW
jgi:hypothetical protein